MSVDNLLERSMSSNIEDWPIVSYSQLQSWDRCEELWSYSYARNWYKVRKDHYLNLGSELHYAFKYYYDMIMLGIEREDRINFMLEYFKERINLFSDEVEMLPILNRCMHLTMMYVHFFIPEEDQGHKILATEHHFTVPFKTGKGRNFILQGYCDLLTQYGGKLWVWDHKSSESGFWTPVQVEMEPQTPLYAAALREQGMKPHGVIINMINTYDYKKPDQVPVGKLFGREKAYKTDKQLDTFVMEMKFIVDDILENYKTPRRSLRLDCKSCSFQQPCAMRIRGINDEPLLREDYVQKEKFEVELKLEPRSLLNA